MRLVIRITLILLLFPASLAAVAGWLAAPVFLHPVPHPLTSELICEADASSISAGARREDFDVRSGDGSLLSGWKVRAANPNGNWALAFHGIADNRIGLVSQSEFLLRAG